MKSKSKWTQIHCNSLYIVYSIVICNFYKWTNFIFFFIINNWRVFNFWCWRKYQIICNIKWNCSIIFQSICIFRGNFYFNCFFRSLCSWMSNNSFKAKPNFLVCNCYSFHLCNWTSSKRSQIRSYSIYIIYSIYSRNNCPKSCFH